MNRTAVLSALVTILVAILMGCAARRSPYDDLYASLKEDPKAHDWTTLEGRRIVIDPGHGGEFDGAVGTDSLTEADVNLGVSLYLWGLLKEAGADVYLTRTTNRDFLPEGSTELRDDLEGRVEKADGYDPEVFISIHHNSNLSLNRDINKVEIYYRSDDPGASLELAQDIRRHLARNLGIEETEIKPGNYFVLRRSKAGAAVLGEASYLSHPHVEKKLEISDKQKLEAEAYFLGLISYFSRGVPVLERAVPMTDSLNAPGALAFEAHQAGGVPLDPASAKIFIGDREITVPYDPETGILGYSMDPGMQNGEYVIRGSIRSVRGATAMSRPFSLVLDRPAAFILPLPASREAGRMLSLGIKVLDQLGQPVADGVKVTARSSGTGDIFSGCCRRGTFIFKVTENLVPGDFIIAVPGKRDTIHFKLGEEPDLTPVLVIDGVTGKCVPFPQLAIAGRKTLKGDSNGQLLIPLHYRDEPAVVSADGYAPSVNELLETGDNGKQIDKHIIRLQPIFDGILKGRKFAIDPAGGGADHAGLGANELRGSSVNFEIARRLRDMLVRAGASVILTRNGEETISIEERIYRVNRFRPELAIGIHHGSGMEADEPECRILHYPGSKVGTALASELALSLAQLPPCSEVAVDESAGLFLQQTSCPACEIHCGSVREEPTEKVLSNPRYILIAAERIFTAALRYQGGDALKCVSRIIEVQHNGLPVYGTAVCIDQAITMTTDKNGQALFTCLIPGRHMVTYETPKREQVGFYMIEITADDSGKLILKTEK